jgi:hypothetical protein
MHKLQTYLPLQTAIDFLETKKVALVAKTIKQSSTCRLRRDETDIFRLKALLLLLQEENIHYPIGELLFLIHSCPIELFEDKDSKISACQVISAFPGEEIELRGIFDREYVVSDLSFPLKNSFQIRYHVNQTGFPHPSQQTAFTWGESIVSLLAIAPRKSQKLASFFYKKEMLAKQLLPTGRWRNKAKAHLDARNTLFQERDSLFFLLKKLSVALFPDVAREIIDSYFEELKSHPRRFSELARVHFEVCYAAICSPIAKLQEEWVIKGRKDLSQKEICCFFEKALFQKFSQDTPCARYQQSIGHPMVKAGSTLCLLLLSKQLGFAPCAISDFEKNVLISVFSELFAFFEELESVPEGISLDLFEEYLTEQIEEKIALFEGLLLSQEYMLQAKELAAELL